MSHYTTANFIVLASKIHRGQIPRTTLHAYTPNAPIGTIAQSPRQSSSTKCARVYTERAYSKFCPVTVAWFVSALRSRETAARLLANSPYGAAQLRATLIFALKTYFPPINFRSFSTQCIRRHLKDIERKKIKNYP